jgi:fructokinase
MRIGVDLGGTKIEAIVIAPGGAELARRRVPAPRDDYSATIAAIADLVRSVEREAGAEGAPHGPRPVGMGIPGTVSPLTGLVKNANSTWLIGHPIDQDLAAALGRPVRVTNDANCFALSEACDGAARDAETVFGVILGTGVGGGLVARKRVLGGRNAVAGEWGHNPLPWADAGERPGPACYCGQHGCIETFLSGGALARTYRHQIGREPDPPVDAPWVAEAATDGDPAARAALDKYVNRLARALAHIINVFDPDCIVLGGGVSNVDALYDAVPKLWARWVFGNEVTTPLVKNLHGDSSGVRGAAWLWPEDKPEDKPEDNRQDQ